MVIWLVAHVAGGVGLGPHGDHEEEGTEPGVVKGSYAMVQLARLLYVPLWLSEGSHCSPRRNPASLDSSGAGLKTLSTHHNSTSSLS